jgi:hypothetical protein
MNYKHIRNQEELRKEEIPYPTFFPWICELLHEWVFLMMPGPQHGKWSPTAR